MDPLNKVKPWVRDIAPYTLKPHRVAIKLNQNENPFDMPAEIKDEVMRRIADRPWSRYPDFEPTSLLEKLAAFSGWRSDGILVGNGSNELIEALLMTVISPSSKVVIPSPTFTLYQLVIRILGGEVIDVPLSSELQFDVPAITTQMTERKADALIICSPNNPTGCVISEGDLRALLKSSDGLIVVDEAYHEFSRSSVVPLLNEFENLVVLRTFSKAMAAAGLRIGYLLASPALVEQINKARLPYNLNFFSHTVAEVAIERFDLLSPLIDKMISERDRLTVELASIDGLKPVPSNANFIVVQTSLSPKRVFDELLKRDILIRDVSKYPMLDNYFRFSVGTPEENDRFVTALREIM
ncbi:MAG TPA: histidinol-phosphate transaminase [Blastocatellia bacterium]|nr:histidinol-phosphate transaminase [Blastocatellia bacterium]